MADLKIDNEVVGEKGYHNAVIASIPATQAQLEAAPRSIDESRKWNFVCPGKCWKAVSGGNVDGGGEYQWYKYGGTWKNKHEYVSGKIKGKAREKSKELHNGHKGPHRKSGHWTPKAKKNDGLVKIGADDGDSDIEVSEVDDDDDDEK